MERYVVFNPNAGKYGPEKLRYGHFSRSVGLSNKPRTKKHVSFLKVLHGEKDNLSSKIFYFFRPIFTTTKK